MSFWYSCMKAHCRILPQNIKNLDLKCFCILCLLWWDNLSLSVNAFHFCNTTECTFVLASNMVFSYTDFKIHQKGILLYFYLIFSKLSLLELILCINFIFCCLLILKNRNVSKSFGVFCKLNLYKIDKPHIDSKHILCYLQDKNNLLVMRRQYLSQRSL